MPSYASYVIIIGSFRAEVNLFWKFFLIYFNVLCYNVTLGNLPIGSVVYYNAEFEVCQPILEKNFFPNLLKTLDSFLHFLLAL